MSGRPRQRDDKDIARPKQKRQIFRAITERDQVSTGHHRLQTETEKTHPAFLF